MRILSVETSCDETSAAVVESTPDGKAVRVLSNIVATSLALHAQTGGIIPEVAARNQSTYILPVIEEALVTADIWPMGYGSIHKKNHTLSPISNTPPDIDALAVTYGPGLIGSLLVGVETVKTLSYLWDKPLIPVNHLFGHIYANWLIGDSTWGIVGSDDNKAKRAISHLQFAAPEFPAIALIVSGGHTDIVLMKSHQECIWIGGTKDDAAGEAYDKVGRLLGLAYPAGPKIEELAKKGNPNAFSFPRPIKYEKSYDFSFSGLKTAVLRQVEKLELVKRGDRSGDPARVPGPNEVEGDPSAKVVPLWQSHRSGVTTGRTPTILEDLCRCTQDAIIDVLVYKTLKAAKEFHAASILLSGGVAANATLRESFKQALATNYQLPATKFFAPAKNLCTDNAAMIGAAAYFQPTAISWRDITANPELYFD